MTLDPGKLRHRLTIQLPVETQDASTGDMIISWTDLATVWAAIEPMSAREMMAAQVEGHQVTTKITLRYRADISAKIRLYHAAKNVYYHAVGLFWDKESGLEYMILTCASGIRDA